MKNFADLLKANPKLTHSVLLLFAQELHESEEREKILAQLSVREKVADALLRIKSKFNPFGNSKDLGVQMTRQEIADLAGTTKEQVSKYLSDLRDEDMIILNGKSIKIKDEEQLAKTAGHVPDHFT